MLARAAEGLDIPIIYLGDPPAAISDEAFDQVWIDRHRETPFPLDSTGNDLAYILYTSGSTGQPKGVMISHSNIRSYIDVVVSYFGIGASARILCTAPFHFDMSTFDVFTTLRTGATLFVASDMLTLFPEKLVSFMEQYEVTLWKGISSLLMYMARAGVLKPGRMPALRQVLFGGEALATRWLIHWMEQFPEKEFYNVYGPTEATGISLIHQVEQMPGSPQELIPIGRPCNDTYVYLLDKDLDLLHDGDIGELFIGGAGLARGYLNAPEKTSQAFIPDPFKPGERIFRTGDLAHRRPDGVYEFLGRYDHQVKIMGYRIELGEIEHALSTQPGVSDVAVVVVPADNQDVWELVAFVEGESAEDPATILEKLKQQLPVYMIPRCLHKIGKLPRNERGKVDRKALEMIGSKKGDNRATRQNGD
jgi:amino acid adenylation domain-containing protein